MIVALVVCRFCSKINFIGFELPIFRVVCCALLRKNAQCGIEEVIFRAIREENKDSLSLDGEEWKYAVRGKNDRENKELRLVVMYLNRPKMLLVTAIDLL